MWWRIAILIVCLMFACDGETSEERIAKLGEQRFAIPFECWHNDAPLEQGHLLVERDWLEDHDVEYYTGHMNCGGYTCAVRPDGAFPVLPLSNERKFSCKFCGGIEVMGGDIRMDWKSLEQNGGIAGDGLQCKSQGVTCHFDNG